jgi:hypothetical protein
VSKTERLEQVLEQHYTVPEIARRLGRTPDWVRKRFEAEKGVLRDGEDHRRGKRRYVTLLVPESVLIRVVREMRQ